MGLLEGMLGGLKSHATNAIVNPLGEMVDNNLTDITTTIGSFIVRSIRGKFQRSITFNIGSEMSDQWMEEALYGILYEYNKVKLASNLELSNKKGFNDGSTMYYKLGDGTHNLKYKKWNILLCIQSTNLAVTPTRSNRNRTYTIITFDLDPNFVTSFERDMVIHRNSLLRIKKDSPFLTIYRDYHEADGWTTWEKAAMIPKRRLNTIYIPDEQKRLLVNTLNNFFASKKFYNDHGISHNLKLLFYGPPSSGKGEPLSTRIPTPDGYKCMGDIKPGDFVFNRTGRPTKVLNIFPLGMRDIYRVTFDDGRYTLCTEDHLWEVNYFDREIGSDVIKVVDTKTMMADFDKPGYPAFEYKYSIPKLEHHLEYKTKNVDIPPYVLGVLIGSDAIGKEDEFITVPNDDNIIKRVKVAMDGYNDHNVQMVDGVPTLCEFVFEDLKCLYVPIKQKDFFKTDQDGLYELVHHIPDDYKYNSYENRLALLQGICDTAALIDYDNQEFNVKLYDDYSILADVLEVVRSLGYSGNIETLDTLDEEEEFSYVRLTLDIPPSFKPSLFTGGYKFNTACIQINMAKYRQKHWLGIKNIEFDHCEEAQCIKVNNKSELYITDQAIITHNTSITKMIASEWNRNLFECTGGKNGRYIPNAIVANYDFMTSPLMSISDIDKYPQLINEPDVDLNEKEGKEEKLAMKQTFNNMINALDGITSPEDRIIVMTTNHIEKFSPTFLRPGRVDLAMEIGYTTPEVFRKYVFDMYGKELPKDIKLADDKLTVGKMQFDVVFSKLSFDDFVKKYVK